MNLLIQLMLNGLVTASMYALVAVGFGLVYRTTNILHIAIGGIYTLSAYIAYSIIKTGDIPALLLGIVGAAVIGVIIEIGIYKPLYRKKSTSGVLLISSLGMYIIIVNIIALIFGNEVKILRTGIEESFTFGEFILTRIQVTQLIGGIILLILLLLLFRKLKYFKAIWAMGEEPGLVQTLGIPIWNLRRSVFIISSALVAVASILTAFDVGIDPHVGMSAFLMGAVAVLVGGKDNPIGWVLSALIIAEIQSIVIWKFSARWNDAITFGILILVLLIRPQGIFSREKRVEE